MITGWRARHTVLLVLFLTSMIAFMDRIVMSVAIPYIAADFDLTPFQSGLVMSLFFAGYSISQIPGGVLSDRYGVRKVATVAVLWWSAFTAATGAVAGLAQMLVVRLLFGLGEGVFPACAFKTVAVWFPKRERATANAVKFAAGPLGSALAPLAVVGIMSVWGWRAVFYALFIPGILSALLFWIYVTDKPAESQRVSSRELAEIEDGEEAGVGSETKIGFLQSLREPFVLKYFLVLFAFDIGYWGFTTWLPTYLVKERGFSMMQMGVAASLPFFAGIVGSLLGGWSSDRFFSSRRRVPIIGTQLVAAFLLYLTYTATSVTMLVVCQTLAGVFLNYFFTAFWALPMNTIPKDSMGVTSGFINMAGQVAAFISPLLIGYLVGAAGGEFNLAFAALIGSVLASCAIAFTLPDRVGPSKFEAVHA